MNTRQQEFLDIYLKYRYMDQRGYYERREKEFRAANEEVITWKVILIGLTTLVSALAAILLADAIQKVLAILAVALPALATALAAYDGLYGFGRHAKLYHDAAVELQSIRGKVPPSGAGTIQECTQALNNFVNAAESIMQTEQGQWGQLGSQPEQAEAGAMHKHP